MRRIIYFLAMAAIWASVWAAVATFLVKNFDTLLDAWLVFVACTGIGGLIGWHVRSWLYEEQVGTYKNRLQSQDEDIKRRDSRIAELEKQPKAIPRTEPSLPLPPAGVPGGGRETGALDNNSRASSRQVQEPSVRESSAEALVIANNIMKLGGSPIPSLRYELERIDRIGGWVAYYRKNIHDDAVRVRSQLKKCIPSSVRTLSPETYGNPISWEDLEAIAKDLRKLAEKADRQSR